MAYQPTDPHRAPLSEEEIRRQARFDNELQPDPMLDESGPSGGKVTMFAVAIAVVLGALFYGLNNTGVHQATTEQGARTAQTEGTNPAAPKANNAPGTTTGAAPSRPAQPGTPQTDNPGAK